MKTFQAIKDWAEEERPREKMLQKGADALTNAELLAILINTGTLNRSAIDIARELLSSCSDNLNELSRLKLTDLVKIKGLGDKKAITLLSAIELGRRRQYSAALERPKIVSSKHAFEILQHPLNDATEEHFFALYLNHANRMLDIRQISKGGLTGTYVDPKSVFKLALDLQTATQIIVAHNHPSGNLQPSQADIQITRKLVEAGKLLDIRLIDHLIIAGNTFYSFADEGKLQDL